jgi:hypothetical protein
MPHFAAAKDQDRLNTLELVKTTLTAKFASKGLVHEDAAWRNIGVYKDGGVTKAVVFDLNRECAHRTRRMTAGWILRWLS